MNSNDKSAEERLQKDLSRWSKISRNTAIRIYKHFFADFGKITVIYVTQISLNYPQELKVSILNQALQCNPYQCLISKSMLFLVLLGYSPEDALQFINAANKDKSPPDYEKIWRSRTKMATTVKNYFKENEDFCSCCFIKLSKGNNVSRFRRVDELFPNKISDFPICDVIIASRMTIKQHNV